jgi:CheY-like chemotaxis protein
MVAQPEGDSKGARSRRRYPRVKTSLQVRVVEASGKSWTGRSDDLSPLGIKVRDGHVPPDSIVHLEFELPGGGPKLTIASMATRSEPDGVAFSFVDLTRPALALIRQAVDVLLLGRKLWVLIVENDRALADLLADYVEAQGHSPIVIPNAEEALAYLSQDRPDAVILDLTLPGMNNLEFLDFLARRGMMLPVLVISGAPDEEAARCLESGAIDFLQKPIDGERLRATLAALEWRGLEERLSEIEPGLGV